MGNKINKVNKRKRSRLHQKRVNASRMRAYRWKERIFFDAALKSARTEVASPPPDVDLDAHTIKLEITELEHSPRSEDEIIDIPREKKIELPLHEIPDFVENHILHTEIGEIKLECGIDHAAEETAVDPLATEDSKLSTP